MQAIDVREAPPSAHEPNDEVRRRLEHPVARSALAAFGIFLAVQLVLLNRVFGFMLRLWDAWQAHPGQSFDPQIRALITRPSVLPIWLRPPLSYNLGFALLRFAVLLVVSLVLVRSGRRVAFGLPVVLWVALPWVFGLPTTSQPHPPPFTVGVDWRVLSQAGGTGLTLVGAVADLVLVLTPAAVASLRGPRRRGETTTSHPAPITLRLGSLALCSLVFVLWLQTAARISGDADTSWVQDLPRFLPVFCLGALLGTHRRSHWALLLVPVLAGLYGLHDFTSLLQAGPPAAGTVVTELVPFELAALLGAAWDPLARALATLAAEPMVGFGLVNALNLADAALTAVVLRSGEAGEANPVVRLIGLPGKVLLVGLASWALMRRRPNALAWPVLVLVGVLIWHVNGLVLSGHVPR